MDTLLNYYNYIRSHENVPWELVTVDNYKKVFPSLIKEGRDKLETIANLKEDEITYESTFKAFDDCTTKVSEVYHLLNHVVMVRSTDEMVELKKELQPIYTQFTTDSFLHEGVFKTLRSFSENPEKMSKMDSLHKRHINEVLEDFREQGAFLSKEAREEFKELQIQTGKLGDSYRNKNQAGQKISYIVLNENNKDEIKGIPDYALATARKEAEELKLEKGSLVFYARYGDSINIMRYCDNEKTREKMWRCSQNVCMETDKKMPDVTSEVFGLLKSRQRIAEIMGKHCWGDYVLSRRMAETADKAMKFVDKLRDTFSKAWKEDIQLMKTEKKSIAKTEEEKELKPWDTTYITRILTERLANFNENDLRDYLELTHFMESMFNLFNKLYGIIIEEDTSDDFSTYLGSAAESREQGLHKYVIKNEKQKKIATLYCDLYTRHGKDQGAWFDTISYDESLTGHTIAVVVTNLAEPTIDTKINKKITKLSLRDAETLLHEWGHALHGILTVIPISYLSGTNVQWDAVELPSQLDENWLYHRESLDILAEHYITKEKVPESIFEGLKRSREFMASTLVMRQLSFGKLDLVAHNVFAVEASKNNNWPKTLIELEDYLKKILYDENKPFLAKYGDENQHTLIRTFSHLFGSSYGYASAYYSYMWAEVLEADVFFSHFKGHVSRKAGEEFKEKFLSLGNSEPAGVLLKKLLGRNIDESALLKKYGLKN